MELTLRKINRNMELTLRKINRIYQQHFVNYAVCKPRAEVVRILGIPSGVNGFKPEFMFRVTDYPAYPGRE
eukprot:1519103-Rhodomonas_salina.1